ncbi:MAG TPA: bifunctional 5,10-methylenetetrahydrofolate dehydrogenase/5,10-methenyltetrahydrofolate cyclohydrolase [Candidatus Paceibacterota bacterium]|nr:bifunctional 5,10-methylenetetrahydrofolate dehydrogenase/5,10-methenyltetrahydrofolate cyclohydrolase [Candidatus Paceibacterota bacterium]
MIVDGKAIAASIVDALIKERGTLPSDLKLGVLMGAEDAASASFVRIKERVAQKLSVEVVRELLPDNCTTEDALAALERLDEQCAGIIIQMPLPSNINAADILAALPAHKDVDAIAGVQTAVLAPVAGAVSEVLVRMGVSASGKKAVVVGAGKLVGAPVAELLRDLWAHVTVITKDEGSLDELKDADIVVLGAGEPGLVKPDMLKEKVVLIDAGTSEDAGRLAGDADPACAEVASVFTPVPGGIGPIAVAMIFKNLFALAKHQ